jgi:hypothetical protein
MTLHRHQRYRTDQGLVIDVNRVAHDESWADVTVTDPGGSSWTKRQRLAHGELPFGAELVVGYPLVAVTE